MTNNYVIDAYAWIEYLKGSEKGKKVAQIIENNQNKIFTSSATFAELISKFLKENKDTKIVVDAVNNLSTIMNVNQEISLLAGKIHFENKKKVEKFGMLDAFVAATAKKLMAKIVTGDSDFRNFQEAIMM